MSAIAILALAASMVTTPEVLAGVIYQTGFEPPDFVASSPLAGQGGFLAVDGANEGAALISTEFPRSGAQSVRIDGAAMQEFEPGLFAGFYYRPIDYDPIASGTPLIQVQMDVALLADAAVASVTGYQIADSAGNLIAQIVISSTDVGTVVSGDNGVDLVEGPAITLGQYSTLGLLLDYQSRVVTFLLDGSSFGTLSFGAGSESTFGDATMYLAAVEPFTSVAYFDNYVITSVPEPQSWLLAATGAISLLAYERRHRRQRIGQSVA